jgi:GAF domain-containing protein
MSVKTEKQQVFQSLARETEALIGSEKNLIANLANAAALINMRISDINWVGFYMLDGEQLVLGPFQGKPACIRIPMGKGVCGAAALQQKIQIIADVNKFPGHIACDSASNSEIVIPVFKGQQLLAVLDVDSPTIGRFDSEDGQGFQLVVDVLQKSLN